MVLASEGSFSALFARHFELLRGELCLPLGLGFADFLNHWLPPIELRDSEISIELRRSKLMMARPFGEMDGLI